MAVKLIMVLLFLTFNHVIAYEACAQSVLNSDQQQEHGKKITGKVTNSLGVALTGVSVTVKGTTITTVTDTNGNYSLSNIPQSGTLRFSFMGMKMQEVKIGNQASVNLALVEDSIVLEEVAVVGYGFQKKKDITGAVSTVSAASVAYLPAAEFGQKLQGKVAGLQINQVNGRPGQGIDFKIRGSAWGDVNRQFTKLMFVPLIKLYIFVYIIYKAYGRGKNNA